MFPSGRGVEIDRIDCADLGVKGRAREVLDAGGQFLARGV